MKEIYLDNAAATRLDPRVKEAMEPFWMQEFGNPGSFHGAGLRALRAVKDARSAVADILKCTSKEIVFTGSGTESINLALKGVFRANKAKGNHIIVSSAEHHAVIETCEYLERYEGAKITYLNVDKYGKVSAEELEKAITPETVLISVIYANNEIGTINNIKELAAVAKKHRVLFHTDACQAGALNLDVDELGVDMMTMNGGKLSGPKGVGVLYVNKRVQIHPIIHGGSQERNLRAGTENVPLIVGFAKALQLTQDEKEAENARLTQLRDKFIKGMLATIPKTIVHGHPTDRLANNVNVAFIDIEGEALLLYLSEQGIYASAGSACTSKNLDPSHVILALGMPYEAANGSVRFTLGKQTTEADIDKVLEILPGLVEKLRNLSPVNIEMGEIVHEH